MKKSFVSIILLMLIIVSFICIDAKATFTIATFADPSGNGEYPLFTVDFTNLTLNGGWSDAQTGLLLDIPYSGNSFTDAWFEMTQVEISPALTGETGGGEINFYADGDSITPLITINFQSGYVDNITFGADEFSGENVIISGSEITGTLLEEEFSFSFANKMLLPGSNTLDDGFTATASFTSSAIPEPATICILGFGALSLIRRKK